MTRTEAAAFNAGVRAALDMARTAAITIETSPEADKLPKRGAVAALYAYADAARGLLIGAQPEPSPVHRAFSLIADEPGSSGEIQCPVCAGRLQWARDASNGHLHGQCETERCLRWMQ